MKTTWRRDASRHANPLREKDDLLAAYLREDLIPFSPYYARLAAGNDALTAITGMESLASAPFTTKEDIIRATEADPLAFVLQPTEGTLKRAWPLSRRLPLGLRQLVAGRDSVRRLLDRTYRPIFMTATTGRAARPVSFLYTGHDMRRLAVAGERMARITGLTVEDRCINLFPYAPHLAFWQVMFSGLESGIFMLSTGGGKTIGTGGNMRALARVNPTCILGVPSYVYHLLRAAEAESVKLPDLRVIVLGAEKIPDGFRERLVDLVVRLGARPPSVIGTYGFTEARMAWAECAPGSGYHLYHDMEAIEIVDPETGRCVPNGESGEIVYTTLGGHGTAVLRYRTGDFAEGGIMTAPCPSCGFRLPRLSPRITRLSNRKDFQLTKVKGTLVDLNHLAALLGGRREIEEWQVEITKVNDDPAEVDAMTLHVTPAPGAAIDVPGLVRCIFEATEISLNAVKIIPLEEMVSRIGLETEMKEKRILDRRSVT